MDNKKSEKLLEILNSLISAKDILSIEDWKMICEFIKENCNGKNNS